MADDLAALLASADMAAVGRRIRQARVTRGLTQSELAGGDISVGYVSRIESGQRRPEPSVLELLAARLDLAPVVLLTGAPDPTLTALQVALDHAELSLRTGAPEVAMRELGAIAPQLDACGVPDLARRGRLTRALTLEALGRLDDAIIELEDLLAEAAQHDGPQLRTAIALSRCYRESGDLARAIEAGDRQLTWLRTLGLEGSTEAIQLAVTVAAAHYERGDVAYAVRMCRRAVEQAERLGTPVAMASAYWNASMMEAGRGFVEAAVPLAAKALRLLDAADDSRNRARLHTTLGSLQLRLDPPEIDAALANLEAAQEQYRWTSASPIDVGDNGVNIARAHLLYGDVEGAEERAAKVLDEVGDTAPLLRAGVLMLLGQAAASRADAGLAAGRYREAVLALSGAGSDRKAAEAWYELGGLLDELGLEREAHDAYRSAGAASGLVTAYGRRRTQAAPRLTGQAH